MRTAAASDIANASELNALIRNQLPALRESAEKWRNGTSLSSVLVTAATLVFARDALADADTFSRWMTGISFAVAAAATISSIGFSARAAFGWPTPTIIRDAGTVAAWRDRELETARRALQISVLLTLVGAVAMAVAVGFLFFGPRSDTVTAPPARPKTALSAQAHTVLPWPTNQRTACSTTSRA